MKKLYLLFFALSALTAGAQTSISITLNAADEDATIDDYNPAGNYPNEIELASRAWTISSVPTNWRSVFKFNLSCIPPNAIIQHASLSLFYATQNGFGNQQQESLTSSNESVVQRVTSAWAENTVTWNNQPSATTADEVILPQSTSPTQDYTNLDVTAMVQSMVSTTNNGFLLKLTNETYYANLLFASGDNPDSSRHPLLEVTFTVPGITCITLRTSPGTEDATIDDYNPAGNYPNEIEYASRAWTISSVPTIWRSLFKFDFPCGMSGVNIQSAYLSLYYAAQNGFGNEQHQSLTSSDESVVQRITSPWAENTVTWNNQPTATPQDQVILPQSTSGTQNYTHMDVTAMVQSMVNFSNNGFLLKLTNETYYASMLFASGDNPDTSKRAKLEICYYSTAGISTINAENDFSIYPVPSNGNFTMENRAQSAKHVVVYNMLGEVVCQPFSMGAMELKVIRLDLKPGIYFVNVSDQASTRAMKIVVAD